MFLHVSESTGSETVDTDICVLIQTQINVSEFQTMFLHVSESTGSGTVDTDICVLIQTQINVSELTQKIVSSFGLPSNPPTTWLY